MGKTEIVVAEMIAIERNGIMEEMQKMSGMATTAAIGTEIGKEVEVVTVATVVDVLMIVSVVITNVIVGGEVIVVQIAMTATGITATEATEAEDEVIIDSGRSFQA